MKLTDFSKSNNFNSLRKKMKAPLISWKALQDWNQFNPEDWKILQGIGLDVSLDEVIADKYGSLEYNGVKVVLYIRDQQTNIHYEGTSGTGYRYHVADCQTLENMRKAKRYERYVVTKRKDGKFLVNLINYGDLEKKQKVLVLKICKNCLKKLNYKKYNETTSDSKNFIWENFSLEEYFQEYDTKVSIYPKHDEYTAPINIYSDNFDEISKSFRELKSWKCEKCGVNLTHHKKLLHAHHIDGNKSNNLIFNLKALCIHCHSEEEGHSQLKNSPDYAYFIGQQISGQFSI